MRILLVANYEPDRQRSMARYAEMLQDQLVKRGYQVKVARPPAIITRLLKRIDGPRRWLGYIDKFVLFPPLLWLRARRADLVHVCDHSNSFYLRWTGGTPRVITAHDALAIRSALGHFPQNPTRATGVAFQRWILSGLNHADRIICVSEKTRQDFEALLPAGPAMTVIPNPLGGDFYPAHATDVAQVRAACGLTAGEEYLLHVGKDNWYKNRSGVLRITAELRKYPRFRNVKLVMAGAPLAGPLRRLAEELQGVVACVGPGDEQLRALYSGALALLFPSIEEGFGWPILEAQACGCPVITTARPPMSEVAGSAAILIDPDDAVGAAHMVAARIADADALASGGLNNVQNYSRNHALDAYCAVYQELAPSLLQPRESIALS